MDLVTGKWTQIVRQNNTEDDNSETRATAETRETREPSQHITDAKVKSLSLRLKGNKTPRQEAINEESENAA